MDVIERLVDAMNDHDPDAVADFVTEDYRSEAPLHPARDFTGREQVRRNWTALFESTPDLTVELLRSAVEGDVVWTETHLYGEQTDGSSLDMRGVSIWGIRGDRIEWGRIYFEPVQADETTWEEVVSVEED